MPITLIRHTRPAIDTGICYGSTDLDIAASFATERDVVIAALDDCDRLISSPLRRCRLLAESIGEAFEIAIEVDERVREMDFGVWEGRRWSEIPEAEVSLWTDDFLNARPHGGESVAMLRARTMEAMNDYQDSYRRTIIVTHSGVIKAALSTGDTADHFNTNIDFGGIVEAMHTGTAE